MSLARLAHTNFGPPAPFGAPSPPQFGYGGFGSGYPGPGPVGTAAHDDHFKSMREAEEKHMKERREAEEKAQEQHMKKMREAEEMHHERIKAEQEVASQLCASC